MVPRSSSRFSSAGLASVLGLACALGLASQSAKRIALPDPDGCTAPMITAPVPMSSDDEDGGTDFVVTTVTKTAAHPQFGIGLAQGFSVDGVEGRELFLVRGTTYSFTINTGGHPFVITNSVAGSPSNSAQVITNGVTNSGAGSGVVTFTPNGTHANLIYYACNAHLNMGWKINLSDPVMLVSVKAYLEGAYNGGTPAMRDDLRTGGHIPGTEPYSALGYTYTGTSGGTVAPAVLTATGDNAIVDWVVVELRSNVTPSVVQASRSALIQRDGDVVSTDGAAPVPFSVPAGTYRVALRHRNHLGVMTLNGVALSTGTTSVDFTSLATATFGTEATKTVGAVNVLWMGDTNFNGSLQYTGSGNDRDPILVSVGSTTPNSTVNGYLGTDLNLNGTAQYTGSGNDRDPVLVNVGSTTPNNVRLQQLP
jgi:hypothetical protein